MIFKTTVPILYSADITRSISYYTGVLGFDNKWEWDSPPTFGGVGKDSVEVFFCKEGQGHPGTWICIMVNDIDALYETVKAKGAKIVVEPVSREWGLREMLVEDPDGHMIRFGQQIPPPDADSTEGLLPATIRIIERKPSAREIQNLAQAIWPPGEGHPQAEHPVPEAELILVAENSDSGEMLGCVFLISDGAGFYYIKNLMVHPQWQHRKIGSTLMEELSRWLENNAPPGSSAWLHSAENLASFYKQFGFVPAFGMYRQIQTGKKK